MESAPIISGFWKKWIALNFERKQMICVSKTKKKFTIDVESIIQYLKDDLGIIGSNLGEYSIVKMKMLPDGFLAIEEVSRITQESLPIMTLPLHCWAQLLTKALRISGLLGEYENILNLELIDGKIEAGN